MIPKTILTSGLIAMALAFSPLAPASAGTIAPNVNDAQVHLAGFKHFKKHRSIGRYGRFVNRNFNRRTFGHRGFYRGNALGYYPGLRKEYHKKKHHEGRGVVTDRYGNPIRALGSGKAIYHK